MRIGAKKRPFYRVVAVDERRKRTGGYLDLLGTYNPLTEPKEINLNQVKIDEWLKKGAQPSNGFLRIIGKAPQKPPRKPKKEKSPDKAPAQPEPENPVDTNEPASEAKAAAVETQTPEPGPAEPETPEAPAEAKEV